MTNTIAWLLAVVLFLFPAGAAADTDLQRMPELSGYYLDGSKAHLPSGLAGPVTLLVFLREDPGADDLQDWREVASRHGSGIETVFVVLMGERRAIERAIAAGRLRGQVHDPELRASTVPVFQDDRDLRVRLGLGAGASALLVNEAGEILWRASGARDQAAPADIGRSPPGAPAPEPGADALSAVPAPEPAPVKAARPAPVTTPAPSIVQVEPPVARSVLRAQIPAFEGVTLTGRTVRLPGDLSTTGTQLVLFPDSERTGALIEALGWMQANADGDWFVLVFKGDAPRFGKAFATGRLRGEIHSAVQREHVLPVYMDISDFEQHAGLGPSRSLRRITVNSAGDISGVDCLGTDC